MKTRIMHGFRSRFARLSTPVVGAAVAIASTVAAHATDVDLSAAATDAITGGITKAGAISLVGMGVTAFFIGLAIVKKASYKATK